MVRNDNKLDILYQTQNKMKFAQNPDMLWHSVFIEKLIPLIYNIG